MGRTIPVIGSAIGRRERRAGIQLRLTITRGWNLYRSGPSISFGGNGEGSSRPGPGGDTRAGTSGTGRFRLTSFRRCSGGYGAAVQIAAAVSAGGVLPCQRNGLAGGLAGSEGKSMSITTSTCRPRPTGRIRGGGGDPYP